LAGLFLHHRFSDFYLQKYPLKNQTSLQEKKFAAGVKKSKEIVENWSQRFLDTKVLISIQDLGKGKRLMGKLKRFYAVFEHLNGSD
jgi:hypothetical protein